jgi:asparagine synthase (glutamine-hydrolysing)
MCGIVGVVAPRAGRFEPVVAAMLDVLGHRGPDGTASVTFERCVLGATRLAVVDPEHGRQPMVADDGRTGVAFNGEVYGHRRLRAGLRYPFRTSCDTEVVLALHRRHGPRFVERLPGMFAYALWDEAGGRLHAGRDRFGEKPFFWLRGPDGAFAFASEVKALVATGWLDPVVDEVALAHFLRHGSVPPDRSIFRDVGVLAPAHRLEVAPGRAPVVHRYWSPPARRKAGRVDAEEAAEALADALDRAVADQLAADVPVGAFLSGGLDSSSVVACAAGHHDDLRTFSFGFGGADDERVHAEAQAARSGTRHRSVGAGPLDPPEVLRRLVRVWDEPFGDASAVPTLLLSEAARAEVTVALTGDGADELLGGYLHWSRGYLADRGVALPPRPPRGRAARRALLEVYDGFRGYLDDDQLGALGLTDPGTRPAWAPTGTVTDLLRYDLEGYLPGDVLVKTDRASMAVGLELRSPFLDVEVAELCLSLPAELLVDEGGDKLVLRRAMGPRLAAGVAERPKLGFSGPMAAWLGREDVQRLAAEALAPDAPAAALVDVDGAAPLRGGTGQATWNLLVLGLWAEANPRARR